MRLSVEDSVALGIQANVYLDGNLLRYVYEADEEAGYVILACCDDSGNVVLDELKEMVVSETKFGAVRIELINA